MIDNRQEREARQRYLQGTDGIRALRVNRTTGALVALYDGEAAGMDTDAGRWTTICETHDALVSHETLRSARGFLGAPWNWCERCDEIADEVVDEAAR